MRRVGSRHQPDGRLQQVARRAGDGQVAIVDGIEGAAVKDIKGARGLGAGHRAGLTRCPQPPRSEEHTSELQSLMRISYAVFCLKKKTKTTKANIIQT